MKQYNFFIYLFTLSLATLQATQVSNKESNNKNERSDTSSTYVHGQQEDWEKWVQHVKYNHLKEPLIKLYNEGIASPTKHIKTTPSVYFVVGPKGAGKSTFIFALQGNKITKKPSRGFDSDSSSSDSRGDTDQLILKKTVKVATPTVATSVYATTEGVKVYYTGKAIEHPIAFCDTEGFLGKRQNNNNNAQKLVGAFAPHFALKSNRIGGIVFVVSAEDIGSVGGKNFIACVHFLKHYFDAAMTGDNLNTLKKSMMLLITKAGGDTRSVGKQLARIVKAAYKDYYKGLLNNSKSIPNTNQKSDKKREQLGQLKRFFSLFLTKDVAKDEINTTKFYSLLDRKHIRFFSPYDEDSVKSTYQSLCELNPLDVKYVSLEDNLISQQLIKQIMHRGHEISDISDNVLIQNNLTQLKSLWLQKDNSDALEKLKSKLQQQKEQFKKKNNIIMSKNNLECVYKDRHIEDMPFVRKQGYLTFIAGKKPSFFLLLQPLTYVWYSIPYIYEGWLSKHFIYTGGEFIYKITIKAENNGNIIWKTPDKNLIAKSFNETIQGNTTTLTSKDKKGIMQDKWAFYHRTAYEQDARCYVEFFSRTPYLKASKLQRDYNKRKIENIDYLLNKLENYKSMDNQNLPTDDLLLSQETANKKIKELTKIKEESMMINFWGKCIFKEKSANQELINQYMNNYNEALSLIDQPSIKNTNSKHSDNQIGLQPSLNNVNQPMQQEKNTVEDEEERKQDDNNNNQSTQSSSSLLSSIGLTVGVVSNLWSSSKD